MKHPPASNASDTLSRRSVGLTDAHKGLIRLLAAAAVESYLHEVEATEIADEIPLDREVMR